MRRKFRRTSDYEAHSFVTRQGGLGKRVLACSEIAGGIIEAPLGLQGAVAPRLYCCRSRYCRCRLAGTHVSYREAERPRRYCRCRLAGTHISYREAERPRRCSRDREALRLSSEITCNLLSNLNVIK